MSMAWNFQVEKQPDADAVVVKLSGEATMDICEDLRFSFVDAAKDPARLMVVDLSELSFMCSEALGALVAAHLKVAQRGGAVRLAGPIPSIRKLFDVTKLDKLFPIYPTVQAAKEA